MSMLNQVYNDDMDNAILGNSDPLELVYSNQLMKFVLDSNSS